MKINFFFAWTKHKDKSDEKTKTIGGGFKLPFFLQWLKIFHKKKDKNKKKTKPSE